MIMAREEPPRRARIGRRHAVAIGHAKRVERHTLAVEHAIEIMIGGEQQARRVGPRRVVREPARIGVAVRAGDRRIRDRGVERPRDIARYGVGRKQPVRVQRQRFHDRPPLHLRFAR